MPLVYASTDTSRCRLQDSRPGWIRYFLSCRALASPTTCRFIPALSGLPVGKFMRGGRPSLPDISEPVGDERDGFGVLFTSSIEQKALASDGWSVVTVSGAYLTKKRMRSANLEA